MFSNISRILPRRYYAACRSKISDTCVAQKCTENKAFLVPPTSLKSVSSHWRELHVSKRFYQEKVSTNFIVQDEDEFHKKVIKASTPIIVDFHAEWCGPCKILGPKLEEAVDKQEGKVLLAKMDVDDHGLIAMKYKIRAVPTVMLFKKGEVVNKFEGNIEEKDLEHFITEAVK